MGGFGSGMVRWNYVDKNGYIIADGTGSVFPFKEIKVSKTRQYKICLVCQQANPKKKTKLNLNDRYCRKCGSEISIPNNKGGTWDIVEEQVRVKQNPYDPWSVETEIVNGSGHIGLPYYCQPSQIVQTNIQPTQIYPGDIISSTNYGPIGVAVDNAMPGEDVNIQINGIGHINA